MPNSLLHTLGGCVHCEIILTTKNVILQADIIPTSTTLCTMCKVGMMQLQHNRESKAYHFLQITCGQGHFMKLTFCPHENRRQFV